MNKIVTLLSVTTLWIFSNTGFAAECTKTLNNIAVNDLNVPVGAVCKLNATAVEGNIHVQKGASLILNNASVSGNVQASSAKAVQLINSSIEGDLNAAQVSTALSLDKSMISGKLYCSSLVKLKSNMSSVEGQTIGKCK